MSHRSRAQTPQGTFELAWYTSTNTRTRAVCQGGLLFGLWTHGLFKMALLAVEACLGKRVAGM